MVGPLITFTVCVKEAVVVPLAPIRVMLYTPGAVYETLVFVELDEAGVPPVIVQV